MFAGGFEPPPHLVVGPTACSPLPSTPPRRRQLPCGEVETVRARQEMLTMRASYDGKTGNGGGVRERK